MVIALAWIGLALVVVVSAFSFRSSDKYRNSKSWQLHSEEVMGKIYEMQILTERAETAQRGFVLTESENFLAPHKSAVAGATAGVLEIHRLVADNKEQTARINKISELLQQKIALMQIPIVLVRNGQTKAAILKIRGGEGQKKMDELRAEIQNFKRAELSLLHDRSEQAEHDFETSTTFTFLGLLAAVAVLAAVTLLLQKEISERTKTAEKLVIAEAKANETSNMKSQFLANMSHEIRTPLNGIIGLTKLLSTTTLNAEQAPLIKPLQDSAHFLLSIINQILDLSKIESGKLQLEEIHFELRSLVQSTRSMLLDMAHAKKISLAVHVEPQVADFYFGDPLRLRQILLNLISNAIKFSTAGTVSIYIKNLADKDSQSTLQVEVQDQGIGMSEEVRSRLFQTFSQGDESTTRRFGGTGLGLSISRQLVELMGGKIQAESTIGVGSKFTLSIVMKQAKYSPELLTPDQLKSAGKLNASVLVAEDNAINQKVIAAMLDNMGCKTTIVENGQDAIDALKKESFDLILMDGQMPILDGYSACRSIREGAAGEAYRNIPIIAVTANAIKGDNEKCLEAGMNDYVPKPISQNDLFTKMQKWIRAGNFPIDISVLARLRLLESAESPDLTREIIDIFLATAPCDMASLRQAQKDKDADAIGQVAHSLKSSCTNVGAVRMQEISSRLEKIVSQDDLVLADGLLSALEKEFIQVASALRGYNAA